MIGEVMGSLSKAKPASHGNIGLTPLDEPLLELLDEPATTIPPLPVPPIPAFPPPEPAVPEDSVLPVPPSPVEDEPDEEHAVKPKMAIPSGKMA